ncbi:hypothetical protein [Nocardioides sp.]|uniref:hypothetical protein n=1 Tax=Nocardioides sp. TaxID=35761 RepID=UPI0035184E88
MNSRHLVRPTILLAAVTTALVGLGAPATSAPADDFTRSYFGDGTLPAGCIVDRDPINPDNECYHMKVGLNALDDPQIDVAILAPVSPVVERDLRVAEQAVQMWGEGVDYLADEMGLDWLADGVDMNITTHELVVDPAGLLTEPLDLVDPEIVVIMSNPAGGIGIGIDPVSFAGELGIIDGEGAPCLVEDDPLDFRAWQKKKGFDQHGQEKGGTYVADCGGVGGNVCFAVNGAVDPVPGASDFFPLYELVAHEFGHCLTVGHVGDGADGPWGPTATNDIMAYSTDPPGIAKCVSTLDVEGFALRMSKYLDVNGDGKVTAKDELVPNDLAGDGFSSFQVQHPRDHHYASSTGSAADCPQPDQGVVPLSYGSFTPTPEATSRPVLRAGKVSLSGGKVKVKGKATNKPLGKAPKKRSASAEDATGDGGTPITDLTSMSVRTDKKFVRATMSVGQVSPAALPTSVTAYSLLIDGRRFDSFIATGDTSGTPVVMDNGTGYYLPEGTATWNDDNTVDFKIRRDYLADQQITAPYTVTAITGYHLRSNDWVATADSVPDALGVQVAAPKMSRRDLRDAPVAKRVTRSTTTLTPEGGVTKYPFESTLGLGGLVSAVDTMNYFTVPVEEQATVEVTLEWTGANFFEMSVDGGSSQVRSEGDNRLTITVPWARRDLSITVDPQQVLEPSTFTLTAKATTVIKDRDRDGVPDVADACRTAKGPSTGAGCPDSDGDGLFDRDDRCPTKASVSANGCPTKADERVEMYVDGRRLASRTVVTKPGSAAFKLAAQAGSLGRGQHVVEVRWIRDGKVVSRTKRTIG